MSTSLILDNPATPEFANWNSYQNFAHRVQHDRRYATDRASRAFIETVMATVPHREYLLNALMILLRAQRDVDEEEVVDKDGDIVAIRQCGCKAERMKPIAERATEGRANPAGIAFLYLASDIETAVSEVRPWIGSYVSVAQFRIVRDLRLVELARGYGHIGAAELLVGQLAGDKTVDPETKRRAVWTDIDNAFSRPVTRDENSTDYVPTQILAEAFREHGYDGLVYRSNFGDPGFNVVLFDLGAAKVISCAPYRITKVKIDFEKAGEAWADEEKPNS